MMDCIAVYALALMACSLEGMEARLSSAPAFSGWLLKVRPSSQGDSSRSW